MGQLDTLLSVSTCFSPLHAGYSISTQSQLLLTALSDLCQKCCFQKRKRFVTTRLHSYNQLHKQFTFTLFVSFSLQSRSGREEILISCHEVPENKQLCLCQFLVDLLRRRRTCSMVSQRPVSFSHESPSHRPKLTASASDTQTHPRGSTGAEPVQTRFFPAHSFQFSPHLLNLPSSSEPYKSR